jgi:hypothetical protein
VGGGARVLAGLRAGTSGEIDALGEAGGEALVVHLHRDAVPETCRELAGERARLARLVGVAAVARQPTITRSTSRSRTSVRSWVKPRLVAGRSTASTGVTIVPVGSLSAQPQRALP